MATALVFSGRGRIQRLELELGERAKMDFLVTPVPRGVRKKLGFPFLLCLEFLHHQEGTEVNFYN